MRRMKSSNRIIACYSTRERKPSHKAIFGIVQKVSKLEQFSLKVVVLNLFWNAHLTTVSNPHAPEPEAHLNKLARSPELLFAYFLKFFKRLLKLLFFNFKLKTLEKTLELP